MEDQVSPHIALKCNCKYTPLMSNEMCPLFHIFIECHASRLLIDFPPVKILSWLQWFLPLNNVPFVHCCGIFRSATAIQLYLPITAARGHWCQQFSAYILLLDDNMFCKLYLSCTKYLQYGIFYDLTRTRNPTFFNVNVWFPKYCQITASTSLTLVYASASTGLIFEFHLNVLASLWTETYGFFSERAGILSQSPIKSQLWNFAYFENNEHDNIYYLFLLAIPSTV